MSRYNYWREFVHSDLCDLPLHYGGVLAADADQARVVMQEGDAGHVTGMAAVGPPVGAGLTGRVAVEIDPAEVVSRGQQMLGMRACACVDVRSVRAFGPDACGGSFIF